jgi:hypothetical protein
MDEKTQQNGAIIDETSAASQSMSEEKNSMLSFFKMKSIKKAKQSTVSFGGSL